MHQKETKQILKIKLKSNFNIYFMMMDYYVQNGYPTKKITFH